MGLDEYFSGMPRPLMVSLILAQIALLGVLNYIVGEATGGQFSFSIFYLAPIALSAWYLGRPWGIVFSLLSVTVWIAVDFIVDHEYVYAFTPFWNMSVRLGFFVLIATVLSSLHSEYDRRRELISQLQEAMAKIKTLRGLIPICAWCKNIRDDKGYWNGLEEYIKEHTDADFTHGICPECMNKLWKEEAGQGEDGPSVSPEGG